MVLLETERLLLRNYKEADFSDVMSYFSSEEVSRYEDFYPMSEKQVKKVISEWKDMDNRFVAELKAEHKVIGSVGYWVMERLGFERMPRLDNQSYKNDVNGQPIIIQTYLYGRKKSHPIKKQDKSKSSRNL